MSERPARSPPTLPTGRSSPVRCSRCRATPARGCSSFATARSPWSRARARSRSGRELRRRAGAAGARRTRRARAGRDARALPVDLARRLPRPRRDRALLHARDAPGDRPPLRLGPAGGLAGRGVQEGDRAGPAGAQDLDERGRSDDAHGAARKPAALCVAGRRPAAATRRPTTTQGASSCRTNAPSGRDRRAARRGGAVAAPASSRSPCSRASIASASASRRDASSRQSSLNRT